MNDKLSCGERESLVEYLYGETPGDERSRIEAHLSICAECREALEALRGARAELPAWTVPETPAIAAAVASALDGDTAPGIRQTTRPWWAPGAFAAAAVLLLAVAAAIANLEITYGSAGISIRTGWSRQPGTTQAAIQSAAASVPAEAEPAPAPVVLSDTAGSPWRDDLAALERRLRTEFQATAPARGSAPTSVDSARLLQRVQELIEQSEGRQRRELALRMAQVVRDFDTQRQTDLVRIQRGLGQLEGNTAADRQILNYLVRASQRQ